MSAKAYRDLPLDRVDANPDQPRKHFDEDKLRELSESIAANGLLEPIIVRPAADDRYLLIAGERRWRASKMAGLSAVPGRVMDVDEVQAYVLSVAENVNRDDMTVMEEARAYDQLRRYGKTVDEVAEVFGKRRDMVEARLLLLDLDPQIVKLVESGVMGALLAWHVARLAPGNQRTVANRFARGELDTAAAVEFAKALAEAETEVGFFDVDEPTEEQRVQHERAVRRTKSDLQKIESLSELLGDLAAADPAALAQALGNDVGVRLRSVERIARQARAAQATLGKAKAVAEARTLVVREG